MFSLDNFYYVLYKNLLQPFNLVDNSFYPFGATDVSQIWPAIQSGGSPPKFGHVLFYDQEPISEYTFNKIFGKFTWTHSVCKMFANSEISPLKTELLKEEPNFYDWYYFFHGFAALDWFRDYRYVPLDEPRFTKVFISLNRLVTEDRSYRYLLLANYIEKDLLQYGDISFHTNSDANTWKKVIFDPYSKLSLAGKKKIATYHNHVKLPLILDHDLLHGYASASLNMINFKDIRKNAMWEVVSETVFYYDKLHLTEKIFKPIVSRRPFILVGAPRNLQYLKSYGFETFSDWIDESYDLELDNDKRIDMITRELQKLCQLSPSNLRDMYHDMLPVLEHNANHFYNGFKTKIVDELVGNFEHCIDQYNNGRFGDRVIPKHKVDFTEVKRRLSQ